MRRPPSHLLSNAEYWVGFGSVKVRTTSLLAAAQIAVDRCARERHSVMIYDSSKVMIGQARLDPFGRPQVEWSTPVADEVMTAALVFITCIGVLGVLIAISRL